MFGNIRSEFQSLEQCQCCNKVKIPMFGRIRSEFRVFGRIMSEFNKVSNVCKDKVRIPVFGRITNCVPNSLCGVTVNFSVRVNKVLRLVHHEMCVANVVQVKIQ